MPALPELRQLRSFIAVAEAGSMSRAAATQHITQQALSQQLRKLEQLLAVTLLRRTSRGVEVTAAGEVLYAEARRVLAAAERAVERAARAAAGEAGRLRLTHTLATAGEAVPRLVVALAERAPELRVEATELPAARIPDALLDGTADLALLPHVDNLPTGIAAETVLEEPLVLAAAVDDPLVTATRTDLASAGARTIFVWPREIAPGYHDAVLTACRARGVEPNLDTSAAGSSVWARIAAGDGVGVITASQVLTLPAGIATAALDPAPPQMRIDLAWPADDPPPSLALVRTTFGAVDR